MAENEKKDDSASLLLLLLLLGLGIAAFFFFTPPAEAEESTSGDELFPAPPPDDTSNPEVGEGAILGSTSYPVTDAKIVTLASAIATAEGFYNSNPNVIPRRAHNPGDLTKSFGQATVGVANSEGVLEFSDDNAGWTALKAEAQAMLNGSSRIYSPLMTIREVAAKYTGNDNSDSWATNAARVMGITPDQTLGDF